jgi:hypothetical protein
MTTLETLEPPRAHSHLRSKIGWLCQLIRWLIVFWIVWALYLTLEPLGAAGQSAVNWNRYWELPEGTVTVSKVIANRAVFLLNWALSAWLSYAVWKLMSGYLSGDILSVAAATRLRLVGVSGLVTALFDLVSPPLALSALSLDIIGKVPFLNWFEPRQLLYILIALFIIAIAYIQRTAAEISDEHKQFV